MVLCGMIYILILKTGSLLKQHPQGITFPYPDSSKYCLKYKNYFLKLCKGTSLIIIQQIIGAVLLQGLPWLLSGKESTCNERDMSLIPGLGGSPGEENSNSLQYRGGEGGGGRSGTGLQSIVLQRVRHDLATEQHHPNATCQLSSHLFQSSEFSSSETGVKRDKDSRKKRTFFFLVLPPCVWIAITLQFF